MKTVPVMLSWSGGKDSALALHALRQDARYQVVGLITSVNDHYGRVSIHGVREVLLDSQAEALDLPLRKVRLSKHPSNAEYERKMQAALIEFKAQGIQYLAFGDLFLEEVRQYRIEQLARLDMKCAFPLWHTPTGDLARKFLALGFHAVLCCVDGLALAAEFSGREYDAALLQDLPATVDPCGENGEFHTFVYAGPPLQRAIRFSRGRHMCRGGRFHFCDLVPMETTDEHLVPTGGA